MVDLAGLEVQPVQHGAPANGNQKVAALDGGRRAVMICMDSDPLAVSGHANRLVAFKDGDAFLAQRADCNGRMGRIRLTEGAAHFDDGRLRAKPGKGLRHFHADRATAEDHQMLRKIRHRENGLIGQVGRFRQSLDRRDESGRPCGDDNAAGAGTACCGRDRVRVGEARRLADNCHAEAFKPLLAIDRGNRLNGAANMRLHRVPVCHRLREIDSIPGRVTRRLGGPGGAQKRLGRNAAIVEAVAAHFVLFVENNLEAEHGRARCCGQAAGPCADDDEIRLVIRDREFRIVHQLALSSLAAFFEKSFL